MYPKIDESEKETLFFFLKMNKVDTLFEYKKVNREFTNTVNNKHNFLW